VAVFLATWSWLRTQKCPRCRTPIYRRTRRAFGVQWTHLSSTPPRRYCSQCGADLNPAGSSQPRTESAGRGKSGHTPAGRVAVRFAGVRRTVVVLIAVMLANVSGIPFLWSRPRGRSQAVWLTVMSITVFCGAAAALLMLGCPRCKERLRKSGFSDYCPRCGWDLRSTYHPHSDTRT
jgi:RNase P subunit RPR2